MGRWGRIVGGVTAVAISVAMLAVSGPAQAASPAEARLHALTNEVRAAAGLPALAFDEELAGLARTWAGKMAADGIISHNPNLSKQVTGNWSKVSENVGQGPDLETVHRALVASKSHYINMTDTEVTLMGVGTVTAGNSIFIVEVFLGRFGAAAPKTTTTKPPAPATTVPKPATTVAPKAPAAPKPAPTTTTVPVTVPVPVAAAGPAIDVSPWGSLVIDVTRTLELATG
jgi:hypothetical protein